MADSTTSKPDMPHNSLSGFHDLLKSSKRILALCGAGLSASSGLPTFRGAGGYWRNHEATSIATPEAFEENPGLVWLFYAYRRHLCLKAQPNNAHRALAALAKLQGKDFLCLTQNVDGEFLGDAQPAKHGAYILQTCHRGLGTPRRSFIPSMAHYSISNATNVTGCSTTTRMIRSVQRSKRPALTPSLEQRATSLC